MDTEHKAKALETLVSMASIYSKNVDEFMAETYWSAVRDLDLDAFLAACTRAVRECEFFPTPAKLRSMIAQTTPALNASNAWPEVLKLASRSLDTHSDPIAAKVMRTMGGGRYWGGVTAEQLPWVKKEFDRVYSDLAESEAAHAAQNPLLATHGGTRLIAEANTSNDSNQEPKPQVELVPMVRSNEGGNWLAESAEEYEAHIARIMANGARG